MRGDWFEPDGLADREPVRPPLAPIGRDDSIVWRCRRGGFEQPVEMRLGPVRIGFVAENGGSEHAQANGGFGKGGEGHGFPVINVSCGRYAGVARIGHSKSPRHKAQELA